jgi:hypothetical protein
LSKPLADTHLQLFEDAIRMSYGMLEEFESVSDEIVNQTAHQMAETFKSMPVQVRQRLLILMEQHKDNPDRLIAFLKEQEEIWIQLADSPWAKFSRMLKGDGHRMTNEDWMQGLYIVLTLIIMLTLPLVLRFGLFPIFQEQASPTQIQSK